MRFKNEEVKNILKERGLKIKWLAKQTGANEGYMYSVLAGRYSPSLDLAKRIAGVLSVSAMDLYEDDRDAV